MESPCFRYPPSVSRLFKMFQFDSHKLNQHVSFQPEIFDSWRMFLLVVGVSITPLSKVPRLFVIARNSTFTYKGKSVKVKQVSQGLGVRYVMEGSLQRSGDRIRINTQLIDALTGNHLWAEHYDRDLKDIFALQDEIVTKILTAVHMKFTGEDQFAEKYFRGRQGLNCWLKIIEGFNYPDRLNIRDKNFVRRPKAIDQWRGT